MSPAAYTPSAARKCRRRSRRRPRAARRPRENPSRAARRRRRRPDPPRSRSPVSSTTASTLPSPSNRVDLRAEPERTPFSSCIFRNSPPISAPSVFSNGTRQARRPSPQSPRSSRLAAASMPMKLAPMTTARVGRFGGGDDRVRVVEAAQDEDVLQLGAGDLEAARRRRPSPRAARRRRACRRP